MHKISLILVLSALIHAHPAAAATAHSAKQISCLFAVITMDDLQKSEEGGEMVKPSALTFTEGENAEFPLVASDGAKYKLAVASYRDKNVDLTELHFNFFSAADKSITRGGALLKYEGKVNPHSGWDFGPEDGSEADKLIVIDGSLQPVAAQAHVNFELYGSILKKYGLRSTRITHNYAEIHQAVQKALAAGEKIPSETVVYLAFNFMNCYRQ